MASPVMISHSDSGGGADRAAHNILQAVAMHKPGTQLWVAEKHSNDPRVRAFSDLIGPESAWREGFRRRTETIPLYLQKSSNSVHRSFDLVPRGILATIQQQTPSVTHLHWLGQGTLSIREIGSLPGPVVWTLHDSWPFCGAEHHPEDPHDHRFLQSYSKASRRPGNSRLDMDAWTFRRKARWFREPRWLVGPSKWMVDRANQASLTSDWPTSVVPNPIDTQVFSPTDQELARSRWEMPANSRVALFGGIAANAVQGKGWDLLQEALTYLAPSDRPWEIWTFGGHAGDLMIDGIRVHGLGIISDPRALASLYSAADIHVVPSRMESFSQTSAESIACGTPVVAFRVGGIPDVVHDPRTGILVDPFDTRAFAHAMEQALTLKTTTTHVGPELAAAWSPEVVGRQYVQTYELAKEEWDRRLKSKPPI